MRPLCDFRFGVRAAAAAMTALVAVCCLGAAGRGARRAGARGAHTSGAGKQSIKARGGHNERAVAVSGFAASTTFPAASTAPSTQLSAPRAIARWDAVPYQSIVGRFILGVVAFHIDGIDRVEFTI